MKTSKKTDKKRNARGKRIKGPRGYYYRPGCPEFNVGDLIYQITTGELGVIEEIESDIDQVGTVPPGYSVRYTAGSPEQLRDAHTFAADEGRGMVRVDPCDAKRVTRHVQKLVDEQLAQFEAEARRREPNGVDVMLDVLD